MRADCDKEVMVLSHRRARSRDSARLRREARSLLTTRPVSEKADFGDRQIGEFRNLSKCRNRFDVKTKERAEAWMVFGKRSRIVAAITLLMAAELSAGCRQAVAARYGSGSTAAAGATIEQRTASLTALSRSGWTASASTGSSPGNAIDGSATTRGRRPRIRPRTNSPGRHGGPADLHRTSPRHDHDAHGFPARVLGQTTSNDGTTWSSPIATGTGQAPWSPSRFASQTARFIRVTLTMAASGALVDLRAQRLRHDAVAHGLGGDRVGQQQQRADRDRRDRRRRAGTRATNADKTGSPCRST